MFFYMHLDIERLNLLLVSACQQVGQAHSGISSRRVIMMVWRSYNVIVYSAVF